MMTKLKLKNSLAKQNYVKGIIQKGICEVKEIVDYAEHKLSPQLVNDLMSFIELEISKGKFSKADFDKSGILEEIMKGCFEMNESDIEWLKNHIQFVKDNKLVNKNTILKKGFSLLKKVLGK